MNLTFEEQQLVSLYNTGDRAGTMEKLCDMRGYLEEDESELMALTDSALEKLAAMTDEEFDALNLTPDIFEEN